MEVVSLLFWAVSTSFLAYFFKWIIWRLTRRLPPGPWGVPLLGYIPFLSSSPYKDYLKLKDKYGPIFGLRLGCRYTVVLSDFADIKETFYKEEFLDRPPNWFALYDKQDHLVNMGGWQWKETRKFTVTALRNLGVGRNKVEETIKEEVTKLIDTMEKSHSGTDTNIADITYLHLLNIIFTITCGRYFDGGEKLINLLETFNLDILRRASESQSKVYYPFLKPYYWIKHLLRKTPIMNGIDEFMWKEIKNHENEFDENNLEDFMAYYINEMKKSTSMETSLTSPNLQANAKSFLFAGTDTSRTWMSWIFLYLAQHQDMQEKMYQEILGVLGKEKPPSWSDRHDLPYGNSFMLEAARYKSMAPILDPRWTNEEETIRGFCIPKNSIILANVEAVHKDKKLWGDPETFRPERFLSPDGKKATAPDYWLTFLIGRRACPGAKLGTMQVFMFVTSIVQKFKVLPPSGGLNVQEIDFLLVFPEKPLVRFELRD